ncbi:MAG: thioredoxin domain-containing protein [Phycisphaerales bacterium]|nr:MAG: thioredoxin domain-containing protein [Phycisphaerales bacterium]
MLRTVHNVALVALCIAGMWVSSLLLREHLPKASPPAWFDAACGPTEQEGVSACEQVARTEWGTVWGMPTAYWGLSYFMGLGLWFLFIGQPSFDRRVYHLLPSLATLGGAAGAVFFIVIMYTRLDYRCFWCMVSHAISFTILILTVLFWPRRPPVTAVATSAHTVSQSASGTPAADAPAGASHPTLRLVLAVLLMALIGGAWLWQGTAAAVMRPKLADSLAKYDKCSETLKPFTEDAQSLVRMYDVNEVLFKHNRLIVQEGDSQEGDRPGRSSEEDRVIIRPDDPIKQPPDGKRLLPVIVFSEFQCGHCRKFARSLEERFNPLFDNRLKIVFKHFPQSNLCNPYIKPEYHAFACQAARAAEAARLQGGNEAFWKAHDLLFKLGSAKKDILDTIDFRKVAARLELDPDRFVTDMKSDAVAERIAEDIELGHDLGVKATPSAFVGGRQIPSVAREQLHFWKTLASRYKQLLARQSRSRQQPRNAPPSTAGNPSQ